MKKFNNSEKLAGEMAIRSLSDKAAEFYNGSDPLDVFEYEENGAKLYAYSGAFGERDGMTFEELERDFEEMQEELEEEEEEEEEEEKYKIIKTRNGDFFDNLEDAKQIAILEDALDRSDFLGKDEEWESYCQQFKEYQARIADAKTLEELADALNDYTDIFGGGSTWEVKEV